VFNFSDGKNSEQEGAAKQEKPNTERLETLLDQLRIPDLRQEKGVGEKDKIITSPRQHSSIQIAIKTSSIDSLLRNAD
jgi:hypothetical protein